MLGQATFLLARLSWGEIWKALKALQASAFLHLCSAPSQDIVAAVTGIFKSRRRGAVFPGVMGAGDTDPHIHFDVALAGFSSYADTCMASAARTFVFNKTLAAWCCSGASGRSRRGAGRLVHTVAMLAGLGPVCPLPCWRVLPESWHCSGLARPCSCTSAHVKGQKAAASILWAAFPSQGQVRACRAALLLRWVPAC